MENPKTNLYQSAQFQINAGIIHGFSGRDFGDLRISDNRSRFFSAVGINPGRLVMIDQVHGRKIKITDISDQNQVFSGYDALLYQKNSEGAKNPVLCIKSADCAPVLFYDNQSDIIAGAHSGWKGTILNIAGHVIDEMILFGSKPENVHIIIGPYIKSCCYSVDRNRKKIFRRNFPDTPRVIDDRSGKCYIDIGAAIRRQLTEKGVNPENIEISDICTSCNSERFFSYRKDKLGAKGMNLNFIAFK
jgi:YfiH family protein